MASIIDTAGIGTSKKVKKKRLPPPPGPTIPRLAGIVFWTTLNCLVPISLLVYGQGNDLNAFLEIEILSYNFVQSAFDLCVLSILRSFSSIGVGFAIGKWYPHAIGIQIMTMALGLIKIFLVAIIETST